MTDSTQETDTIEIETGPNPSACVVLMHGLGADGNDFVPIVDELDLTGIGDLRFVFPNAPHQPVTINGGYVMPAWYDIYPPQAGDAQALRREDEAGLRQSQRRIEAVLAREKARGIAAQRIVLAGFSQGCAMALLTGLRHTERLAGIMGLSGYLPLAGKTAAEVHPANAQTPVFLAHGRQDPMVVLDRATASRDVLKALGYRVRWHEYTMGHSVCAEEIADMGTWLREVLRAA